MSTVQLHMQRAKPHQASRLHRLFMDSLEQDFHYFTPSYQVALATQHTTWRFLRALAAANSLFFIVKTSDNTAVGYNLIRRDSATTAFLHWMYLHPSWRGQGHGRWIMRGALQHLARTGVNSLRLVTHDKTGFYERLGFEIISAAPIRLGGVDMSLMEYNFNETNEAA